MKPHLNIWDQKHSTLVEAYKREQARRRRELIGVIVLGAIVSIIVFLFGMALTHGGNFVRALQALT